MPLTGTPALFQHSSGEDGDLLRLGSEPEVLGDRDPSDPGNAVVDGDHGEGVTKRARNVSIGEQVAQRLRSLHAEWPDAVALAPGSDLDAPPKRRGVEGGELRAGGIDRSGMDLGPHLPAPEPRQARQTQGDRLGRRLGLRRLEADEATLALRGQAAAQLDGAALGTVGEAQDLRRTLAAQRYRSARRPLGQDSQHQTPQAELAG